MNKIHKRRLYTISFFIIGLSIAAGLIFYALRQNMNVYLTPNQLTRLTNTKNYHFRLGGMVKQHSVIRDKNSLAVTFVVTDFKRDVTVHYVGILPDLFREGKGMIAEGSLNAQGEFIATQVLAKHDENYMPKQIQKQITENQTP